MTNRQITLHHELKGHIGSIYSLTSDDDQYFYSVGGDGWVVQWDLSGSKTDGLLIAETDAKLFSVLLLKDKNILLAGDMNGFLYWLDLSKRTIIAKVKGHQSSIFDIYKISDQELVTISKDGYLCIWDIEKQHPKHSFKINYKGLRCIEPDTERNVLYLGGSDKHIYTFSLRDNTTSRWIENAHENSVFTILKLNSNILITGGRDAHMKEWDISQTPRLIQSLPAHWYTINSIVYMPNLNLIASGSRDKTVRLWDDDTLQSIQKIDVQKGGHINSVNKLLWSQKYRILISASDDRTIRMWKMNET